MKTAISEASNHTVFESRPTCFEVFRWPEFQALMTRLGVPWEGMKILSLTIDLPDAEAGVKVTCAFRGCDKDKDG